MASSDSSPSSALRNDHVSQSTAPSKTPTAKSTSKSSRKGRRATSNPLKQGWEEQRLEPYHEYVRQLVDAGWNNLKKLDEYMSQNRKEKVRDLTVSILDITDNFQQK